MKLKTEILRPEAKRLLGVLPGIALLEDFYLAGGTSLALQLGHRESIDFDFFTQTDFQIDPDRTFAEFGEINVIANTQNYCEFIADGVKIMLMSYFYPKAEETMNAGKLQIASIMDIGLMKMTALEGRMNWKDIVDLYFIDKAIGLEKVINTYQRLYPEKQMNQYSQLKILLDVGEIDKSPKPKMLVAIDFLAAREMVFRKLINGFAGRVRQI